MHTLSQQLNLFKRGVLVANGLNDLFGLSCLTSTKQKQRNNLRIQETNISTGENPGRA